MRIPTISHPNTAVTRAQQFKIALKTGARPACIVLSLRFHTSRTCKRRSVSALVQDAKDVPAVMDMLGKARAILGYDLLDLCQNGPKEKLDNTAYAQPALFVAGLAAVEKLRQESPQVPSSRT